MIETTNDPLILRKQARIDYFGGISADTEKRWLEAGKLPPPIRLSRKKVGWRKSTLEALLASRQGVTS